jgi:mono/diheme cytochrome c family protein
MLNLKWLLTLLLLALAGCGGGGGGGGSDEGEAQTDPNQFVVTDTEQYFAEHISPKIIQVSCITCHISGGVAKDTPLNYVADSVLNHTELNRQTILAYFANESGNAAKYLQKVQGQAGHSGGEVLNSDSDEYKMLEAWVQAVTQ